MKSKQQGTALLLALLITAIVAIIAFAVLEKEEIHIQRTALMLNANQASLYARGTQIWAEHLLTTDIYKKTDDNAMPLLNWPKIMPAMSVSGDGKIQAVLIDAQSFFNLNNLQTAEQQKPFEQLLTKVAPQSENNSIPALIRALVAWISPPGKNADVVSESYYLSHDPPYQSAHRELLSITEARLVSGMSANLYNALSPYIIALPGETSLNINTASAVLLATLGNGLSIDQVQQIIDVRNKNEGFINVANLAALPFMKEAQLKSENLTTTSNYFLLRTDITFAHQQLVVFTLFHREPKEKNPALVKLIWQSIGTL